MTSKILLLPRFLVLCDTVTLKANKSIRTAKQNPHLSDAKRERWGYAPGIYQGNLLRCATCFEQDAEDKAVSHLNLYTDQWIMKEK